MRRKISTNDIYADNIIANNNIISIKNKGMVISNITSSDGYILNTSDIGVQNGVCPLDANGIVPANNLPNEFRLDTISFVFDGHWAYIPVNTYINRIIGNKYEILKWHLLGYSQNNNTCTQTKIDLLVNNLSIINGNTYPTLISQRKNSGLVTDWDSNILDVNDELSIVVTENDNAIFLNLVLTVKRLPV